MTDLTAWPPAGGDPGGVAPPGGSMASYSSFVASPGLFWGGRLLPTRTVTVRGVTFAVSAAASAETPISAAIYEAKGGLGLTRVGQTPPTPGRLAVATAARVYLPLTEPVWLRPGTVYFAMLGFDNPLPTTPPQIGGINAGSARPTPVGSDVRQSPAVYFSPPIALLPPEVVAAATPLFYGPYVFATEEGTS